MKWINEAKKDPIAQPQVRQLISGMAKRQNEIYLSV